MNSSISIFLFFMLINIFYISGQDNPNSAPGLPSSTCFGGCSTEYNDWFSSWQTAENAFLANPTEAGANEFYTTICTDQKYTNLIKCFANSCANTVWSNDLADAWRSFEASCADNGHPVSNGIDTVPSLPDTSTGSGGNNPDTSSGGNNNPPPAVDQCSTQCDAISKQVADDLNGITNNNYAQLCTSSVPNFFNCLKTYCSTNDLTAQAYNNAYNGFASACRAHGYNVGAIEQGTSKGYSNTHFSVGTIVGIGLLSLLAIKFA